MSTISYRQLDANWDPRWGQSQSDFLTDLEAVAQAIWTRLLLFQAEWWKDRTDGLPVWQSILGVAGARRNLQANTILIVDRILGTPYVTGVTNVTSSFDPITRTIKFFCRVQTQFGSLVVSTTPTPSTPQPPVVPASFILQDPSGILWQFTMNSAGLLLSNVASSGTPATIYINDNVVPNTTYQLGVNTFGLAIVIPVAFQSSASTVFPILAQGTGNIVSLQISNGLLSD